MSGLEQGGLWLSSSTSEVPDTIFGIFSDRISGNKSGKDPEDLLLTMADFSI